MGSGNIVMPHPDLVLGDRYALVRRIARGAMGEVWEATDHLLGRAVAVKILRDEYRTAPQFLTRFRAEARQAGRLDHRGIATVYDYGESNDVAFLVTELVDGHPLSHVMAEQPGMPTATKLSIICQAAEGLQAAHDAGVIHRDVRPGNLLVRDDGVVKVTDFGISRALASVPSRDRGGTYGTPTYLSPEQASGARVSDASDTYSLGAVAYELLAGHAPVAGAGPVEAAPARVGDPAPPLPASVSANVAAIVQAALAQDPSRRPASAGDVARVLRRELATMRASPAVVPASSDVATQSTPVLAPDERQSTAPLQLFGVALTALLLMSVTIGVATRLRSVDTAPLDSPASTAISQSAPSDLVPSEPVPSESVPSESVLVTQPPSSGPGLIQPAVTGSSIPGPNAAGRGVPGTSVPRPTTTVSTVTGPGVTEPPATQPPATPPGPFQPTPPTVTPPRPTPPPTTRPPATTPPATTPPPTTPPPTTPPPPTATPTVPPVITLPVITLPELTLPELTVPPITALPVIGDAGR
jgi:eukaryotic-like serine/threonine-protein kinase